MSIDSPFFAHTKPILNPFLYQISFWYDLGSFLGSEVGEKWAIFCTGLKMGRFRADIGTKMPCCNRKEKRQPFYKLSLIYKEYFIMVNYLKGQSQRTQTYQ